MAEPIVEALEEARERTLALVASVADDDLERVHSELMSPLVWDLGHIAAFEDLWIGHRYGGRPLLREDLAEVYDAFETPRAQRGDLPYLRTAEAHEYLAEVRERSLEVISDRGVGDGVIPELIVRHEQQHTETMLQTLQLAQLSDYEFEQRTPDAAEDRSFTGLELVAIPAGACILGAPRESFAYDNERPRHRTELGDYMIGLTPITNATYRAFVEGGGCGRPVVHISWFEADAFARSHGLRLPTEAEWEKAATWDHELGIARTQPWGDQPLTPGVHANVDQLSGGPVAAGGLPAGASPYGCLAMIGDVWEWTASDFVPYPGFEPFPYREYSEVFFGSEYKVLRGGSWATRARVSTPTFRNWDYQRRRQIFAGLRVAGDF